MKLISYKVWGNPRSTWLDKLISIVSFSKYSHTEIVFRTGESFSISPRENIARLKTFEINSEQWDIVDLHISPTKEKEIYICAQIIQNSNYKYNYIGVVSPYIFCGINKKRLVCSQICAEFLKKAGYGITQGCDYNPSKLQKHIRNYNDTGRK